LPNAREPQQLERLAPGRDQIGEVGDIVSESPGDFISVHPGDFVGIRILSNGLPFLQCIVCC
ncbi:MAG: hypothetical protein ACK5AX_33615, partial [Bradyrhizobium sp.]|uniref:hypothetical protein n=1 Tax=Bradyrhizobium sp. TaxID=376 RepID=UPI00391D82A7